MKEKRGEPPKRRFHPKVRHGKMVRWYDVHNLYSSPHVIRVFKSRRMRCAGRGARIGGMSNTYKIRSESVNGGDHLGYLGIDGRIMLIDS